MYCKANMDKLDTGGAEVHTVLANARCRGERQSGPDA